MTELRRFALEELPPRRRVLVEVVHLDRSAGRLRGGLDAADASPRGADGKPAVGPRGAAREADARNRGDARQGLAAETEGSHVLQVVERGNLARRVPRERHRQGTPGDAPPLSHAPDSLDAP